MNMTIDYIPMSGHGIPEGTMVEFEHHPGVLQAEEPPVDIDVPMVEAEGQPTIHYTIDHKRPSHPWRRRIIGAGMAVLAVGAAVNFIADRLPELPHVPDAHHSLDVTIDKVKTEIVYDTSLNYADVEAEFDYAEHNSLDKWGPTNCDASVVGRITTAGAADIQISKAIISTTKNKAVIEVAGDISAESHMVVQGLPDISIATGSVDICNGDNEEQWAKRISFGYTDKKDPTKNEDGVIQNAGEIATACVIAREGRPAFDAAIKKQASAFSKDLKGIDPKNITVKYQSDFDKLTKAELDKKIAEFYKEFYTVADLYYAETDDHTAVNMNAKELIECPSYKIAVTTP